MATLYARYAAADNNAPGGHSPDTIWNTQADGGGSWAVPASGDTLDTNGYAVTGSLATGYPGAANTDYTIQDTAGTKKEITFTSKTLVKSSLIRTRNGGRALLNGCTANGLLLVQSNARSDAQVQCIDTTINGHVLVEKGGKVGMFSLAGTMDMAGLCLVEDGGYFAMMDLAFATPIVSGTILAESGATVNFDGSSVNNISNTGFIGYYTGATMTIARLTGNAVVAIGTERRTTHFTGALTSSISILDDTKVLKNTDIIAAAADVRGGTGRWTGATGGDVGTMPAGYAYGDASPDKVLKNATGAGNAYGDTDAAKVLTTATVAGTDAGASAGAATQLAADQAAVLAKAADIRGGAVVLAQVGTMPSVAGLPWPTR
jgi:hypothetical protein